jgi:hypothetical protein
MIPVKQTKTYPKNHAHIGNGFQACLASILETDIENIPNFGESEYTDMAEWREWLKESGLVSWVMPYDPQYFKINKEKVEGYFIGYRLVEMGGVMKRSAILIDDGQIIHDPADITDPLKKFINSGVFVGRLL